MSRYVFYRRRDLDNRPTSDWIVAKCRTCGEKLMKDPNCSGDYYPGNDGAIILMSYCPKCGLMYPFLLYSRFSNNRKKNIAIKIAKVHHKGFSETKEIVLNVKFIDAHTFSKELSKKLKISQNQIKELM